ncbi:MAG: tripartite tricarboxylate transporter permease, partial [Hyphomicrobiales bacterium]
MSGLADAFDAQVLLAIVLGVPAGLIGGLLPGVTGIATLALLIPFTFGMDPLPGLAFLLSAHAVIYTGGSVTAILFGIPGAPANAATVADG